MVTRLTGLMVTVLLILGAVPALAGFTCEASVNRDSVPSGGEVILTVSAQGDVGWSPDFRLPSLPGVRIYAGGTNQSMSVVNGATETSVSRIYYLKVETDKDFTIAPVTIVAGKEQCATSPIDIKVTAAAGGGGQVAPGNTGNRTQRAPDGSDPAAGGTAGKAGDDIFITLEADQTTAWVGQQVVLTFRYWWRVQPWNNPSYTPPRTEGFWREDLGSERKFRKVLYGRAYNVTEIRYAIFPTRVGELTIEPAELSFPEGVFDRFFQTRRTQRGPNILRTEPVTITVKELPTPHPADYSGIVASRLKLISQVDRDSVPRGEAIGFKVLLEADGFLKGFSDLKVPQLPTTRLHDAGESFRTTPEDDRLAGRITVEKVIVPDEEGDLEIPPVKLVWFDTGAGQFRTAATAAWDVTVTPSDLPRVGADQSGFLRNEIARLGEDLAFIHQAPGSLSRRAMPWTGGVLWWAAVLAPLLLLGAFRLFLRRIAAERRDPAGRRRRGALAAAEACLDQPDADPTNVVVRAVCGYVADCHDRPLASVGPAEVKAHCTALGSEDAGARLAAIMAECDAARYGQSDPRSAAELIAEVRSLLAALDAALRGRRGNVPRLALLVAAIGLGLALFSMPSPAAAADDRPGADPVRLVAEGNQAYTEGKLEDAAAKYIEARDLGVNDAVLHFNLGNTYARSGRLGEAVVCYLRAQRLDPANRDIRDNLAWVRRHIRDLELSETSLPLFIAQLAALVGALTLDQWGLLLAALVWVAAGLLAWGWYREEIGVRLRRGLLAAAAAVVLVGAVTAGRWYDEQVRQTAVVVVPEVVVRSGPAANFSTLFEVHDGLTLEVVGRRDDWLRVGLGGDWEGWVPAESVLEVRPAAVGRQGR